MKKIFTLLTIALFSVATFADGNIYYYRGNQNGWGADPLTPGPDGLYEYFAAKGYTNNGNQNNNFKIALSTDSWDYNFDYLDKGFNGTNITNAGKWDSDNICIYNAADFYILVYYPNTCINTTDDPIVCASTTLPEEKFYVAGPQEDGWLTLDWNTTDNTYKMTRVGDICSITISDVSAGDATHKFKVSTYSWKNDWGHAKYDAENSENVVSESDADGNLEFKAAMTGTVTIYFDVKTADISIVCQAPVISFDNEGGEGVASQNTYYGIAATSVTPPTRDGYTFAGYYDGDNGTGTLVINASGAWQASIANLTDEDTKWIVRAGQTLYAKWTQDPGASLAAAKSEDINVGETVRLTATATNCEPTNYAFFEGDAVEPSQSGVSEIFDYTPTTVGNKTIKVVVTHAGGSVEATHDLTLNVPAVALAVKAGSSDEVYLDETTTILVATPSNVGAGVTPSYVFTDQAETPVVSASQTTTEWTYVPGELGEKEMKVTMSVGGATYTATTTVNVYKHWTIYVKEALSWGAMSVYSYSSEAHGGWPGTACDLKSGETDIYVVTLDSKGTMFILNSGSNANQTINLTASEYAAGTYWKTINNEGIKLEQIANPATGIDNTEAGAKSVKRIVNGQLLIIRDGKTYNAIGVEVK